MFYQNFLLNSKIYFINQEFFYLNPMVKFILIFSIYFKLVLIQKALLINANSKIIKDIIMINAMDIIKFKFMDIIMTKLMDIIKLSINFKVLIIKIISQM